MLLLSWLLQYEIDGYMYSPVDVRQLWVLGGCFFWQQRPYILDVGLVVGCNFGNFRSCIICGRALGEAGLVQSSGKSEEDLTLRGTVVVGTDRP